MQPARDVQALPPPLPSPPPLCAFKSDATPQQPPLHHPLLIMLRTSSLLPRVALTLSLLLLCAAAPPHEDYESLCEAIAKHAQAASRAHNSGDISGAQKHVARAEAAFKRAVAMDDAQPYAYMNYGSFLANANRFDDALQLLDQAMQRLKADPNADPEAVTHVEGSMRHALYGRASMKRDIAYEEGQGNVTAAWLWAQQQLPVSPFPPRTLHDIATMELMLCDAAPHKCKSARERLQQAQQSSARQYMAARAKGMPQQAQQACHASAAVLSGSDWLQCPEVSEPNTHPLPPGLHALRVAPPLRLLGRDGMLLLGDLTSPCACSLLSPASDPLLDVFANIASNQDPAQRQSSSGDASYHPPLPLLSLVQFAARSFYHWMCEALPRLVVAQAVWGMPSSATYNVIIPTAPPSFVMHSLRALGVTSPIDYRRGLLLAKARTPNITTINPQHDNCKPLTRCWRRRRCCLSPGLPNPLLQTKLRGFRSRIRTRCRCCARASTKACSNNRSSNSSSSSSSAPPSYWRAAAAAQACATSTRALWCSPCSKRCLTTTLLSPTAPSPCCTTWPCLRRRRLWSAPTAARLQI